MKMVAFICVCEHEYEHVTGTGEIEKSEILLIDLT